MMGLGNFNVPWLSKAQFVFGALLELIGVLPRAKPATKNLKFEEHRDTRVEDGAEMTLYRFCGLDALHCWYVPVVRDASGAPSADLSQVPESLRKDLGGALVRIEETSVYRFKKERAPS